MDTLKGKQIMVWTFMGNTRMYQALRDYGDRISQIGLFSFKVRATGEIYESGVSIAEGSTMRTYIRKWPHIKWLLTVANDGTNSIFKALRENTGGAQDKFLSELVRIMEKYPWCDGVDIDLEKGDDYSTAAKSTAMFRNIYNTVKSYNPAKLMNICLPGMDSINGSVGGENWCVYGDLNNYCDTASIMSYGMAWAGSAPGPVSPRSWLEGIYNYAVKVMDPDKVFLGMPAYGWNWRIHDTPKNMPDGGFKSFGRISRSNAAWDEEFQVFTLTADVEESSTRSEDISMDYDFFHSDLMELSCGNNYTAEVIPKDINIWISRLFLGDADGFSILYYQDVDSLVYWANQAAYRWKLRGMCMWSLGQEDMRLWEWLPKQI